MVGVILMNMISLDAGAGTYACTGAVIGGITAIFYGLFKSGMGFPSCFSVEVGFGCTRKQFFFSYYLVSVILSFLAVPLVAGLYLAELAVYGWRFPDLVNERDLLPLILGGGTLLALVIPLLAMLAALLVMRFGKPALWVMWGLWMFGFVAVPNMLEAAEAGSDSAYGWAGRRILWVAGLLPTPGWICAGIAAVALCFGIAWRMAMRQQVNH